MAETTACVLLQEIGVLVAEQAEGMADAVDFAAFDGDQHLGTPGAAKPVRKVSYLMAVPGRSRIVGAGVYDDVTPIDRFEDISRVTL